MRASDTTRCGAHAALGAAGVAPHDAVVEMRVDGAPYRVDFAVDAGEHARRQGLGVGAVTDRRLLHALWELPSHVPVPAGRVAAADLDTIARHGHGFVEGEYVLTRTFAPAGTVTAVAAAGSSIEAAFRAVTRIPPIYWRVATASALPSESTLARAGQLGVGVVVEPADVAVEPQPPRRGVPGVYRWWIAERAYRAWLYANCAHCCS